MKQIPYTIERYMIKSQLKRSILYEKSFWIKKSTKIINNQCLIGILSTWMLNLYWKWKKWTFCHVPHLHAFGCIFSCLHAISYAYIQLETVMKFSHLYAINAITSFVVCLYRNYVNSWVKDRLQTNFVRWFV